MENNPYESKVLNLLKKKGSLMAQEDCPVYLLSVILEDFISDRLDDPRYEKELAFAKRLDVFLLSDDKSVYYDA